MYKHVDYIEFHKYRLQLILGLTSDAKKFMCQPLLDSVSFATVRRMLVWVNHWASVASGPRCLQELHTF